MFKHLARSAQVAFSAALLFAGGVSSSAHAAETVVDRSAFSTTVAVGGALKTRTYPEAVNFQNDDGKWSQIDRTLEPQSDGTVRPAAVDGDASIPSNLTRPVVLEHDGRSISFRLLGADGGADRDTSGVKATFDGALAGVDVSYKVRTDGLKELVRLQSRAATRAFAYDVRADSDLTAAIVSSDLVFRDQSGTERFHVAAPLAWDSAQLPDTANALTLSVDKTGDRRWRLTMRVDDKWLDDPARVFPVTLDPDYTWIDSYTRFHGANQDCALAGNDFANRNLCGYTALQVGYGNGRPYKSVMKFDISAAIPVASIASKARFLAWQFPSSQKFERSSRLRTVTSPWDNTATWNKRMGGTPWTTVGGDTSTDPALTGAPTIIGPSGYWSYWDAPLAAVNGWIKQTLPNYGFQLSTDQTYPDVRSAYEFTSTDGPQESWPALEVTWTPDTPPTLAVTGTLIDHLATAFRADENGDFKATANGQGAALREVTASVDGQMIGSAPGATCADPNCSTGAEANMRIDMDLLSPGTHTVVVTATDIKGRATTRTYQFQRAADPSYPAAVASWITDIRQRLGTAGALPAAATPSVPAGVLQTGACADVPSGQSCVMQAASWAADMQAWLSSASNPSAAPVLPDLPRRDSANGAQVEASRAAGGMMRFAAAVAKSPNSSQAAGVIFKAAASRQSVTDALGANTVVSNVAFQGSEGPGDISYSAESSEATTLAAALTTYYTDADSEAASMLPELQARAAEDPSDQTVKAALNDIAAYRQGVSSGAAAIRAAAVKLSPTYARGALRAVASSSLLAVVAPQATADADEVGSLDQDLPRLATTIGTTARVAAAAAEPEQPTCRDRKEDAAIDRAPAFQPSAKFPNPEFWAPSRYFQRSYRDGRQKVHQLFFQWNGAKSLSWLCTDTGPGRRGIEMEVRVPDKNSNKFSDAWANNDRGKKVISNLPGRSYRDDIAKGSLGIFDLSTEFYLTKQDYPDFSVVADDERNLRYKKVYWTRFRTNNGTDSTDTPGIVQYTAQATAYARGVKYTPGGSFSQTDYCNLRDHAYKSCQFSQGVTICYRQTRIDTGWAKQVVDWGDLQGNNNNQSVQDGPKVTWRYDKNGDKSAALIEGPGPNSCVPNPEP